MDYEKKYKEALERAKKLKETCDSTAVIGWCEYIFSELKESEDERIRKDIIAIFKGQIPYTSEEDAKKYIAWLEKQGEQHSAIRWYDVSLIPQEMEELLVEWDSEDATWHEIAFYHADTKTFWNGTRQVENVTRWCYIIDLLEKQGEKKPQRIISAEAKEAMYNKSVEWSEEDEKHRNAAICACTYMIENFENSTKIYEDANDWLKSLKDRVQPQWKPSDDQIAALRRLTNSGKSDLYDYRHLKRLLEQLEKL